jgi:transposase
MKNQVESTVATKKVQSLIQKGYSYRQVADMTNLDLNTIKNVSRGKSKMIKLTTHLAIERVYAQDQARELYEEQMEQDAMEEIDALDNLIKNIMLGVVIIVFAGIFVFFALNS